MCDYSGLEASGGTGRGGESVQRAVRV